MRWKQENESKAVKQLKFSRICTASMQPWKWKLEQAAGFCWREWDESKVDFDYILHALCDRKLLSATFCGHENFIECAYKSLFGQAKNAAFHDCTV